MIETILISVIVSAIVAVLTVSSLRWKAKVVKPETLMGTRAIKSVKDLVAKAGPVKMRSPKQLRKDNKDKSIREFMEGE